jgi:glycosyltransferase involved in cell wall biosynthesis
MACGLPVLLTPGCNFPEVVSAGAGLVVPREVPALSGALGTLLTEPDHRASMGRSARRLIQAQYTWPRVVAQLAEAYTLSIERRSRKL